MSRVLETTLVPMQLYRACKRFHYRPSQSWPCMFIHNPYWIIKCANIPLSITVGFVEFIFTSLIYISWHTSRLPRLFYLPKSLVHPRQFRDIHENGCSNLSTTQWKVNSPRVPSGLSWVPRPYKWRLKLAACQINIFIIYRIENRKKTTLSSRQACFVIAHSSGDFIKRIFRTILIYCKI